MACIKSQPDGVAKATTGVAELVDTFPLDQESWLELAALYLEQGKYPQAAYALEELILLAPQNSFYLLKYAEILYTAGETAKAYKIYLRILELGEGNLRRDSVHPEDRIQGPWVRTLWGLKLVRMQAHASAHSDSWRRRRSAVAQTTSSRRALTRSTLWPHGCSWTTCIRPTSVVRRLRRCARQPVLC